MNLVRHAENFDEFMDLQDEQAGVIREEMAPFIKAGIWVTNDGREIPIKEMGTGHIIASLRMINRYEKDGYFFSHSPYKPLLVSELARREGLEVVR